MKYYIEIIKGCREYFSTKEEAEQEAFKYAGPFSDIPEIKEENDNIKFFYNGIKDIDKKLQPCYISAGRKQEGWEIFVSKKNYTPFSEGIRAAFTIKNDTDSMTDYFEHDHFHISPDSPYFIPAMEAVLVIEEKIYKRLNKKLESGRYYNKEYITGDITRQEKRIAELQSYLNACRLTAAPKETLRRVK